MKTIKKITFFSIGAVIVGALSFVPSMFVRTDRFVDVAARGTAKTLMIYSTMEGDESTDKTGTYMGTGVFISSNNHILTCAHLFDHGRVTGITVCNENGDCGPADLLGMDTKRDLALLQSFYDTPTPYADLADPRTLRVGQEVLAIGQPLGIVFTVNHGIISALNRDIGVFYNLTQSDVMISPGNSGGPLFNLDGKLVGINNRMISTNMFFPTNPGISFSVQPAQIIEFVTRIRKQYQDLPKYKLSYWN